MVWPESFTYAFREETASPSFSDFTDSFNVLTYIRDSAMRCCSASVGFTKCWGRRPNSYPDATHTAGTLPASSADLHLTHS